MQRSEQNCTIFKLILTQSWLTLQNDMRVLYALPRANIACSGKYMGILNCSIFVSLAEDCKIWCLSLDITPLFGAILVQMDVWNMVIKRHRLSSSKTPRYMIVCLLWGTVTVPSALSTLIVIWSSFFFGDFIIMKFVLEKLIDINVKSSAISAIALIPIEIDHRNATLVFSERRFSMLVHFTFLVQFIGISL